MINFGDTKVQRYSRLELRARQLVAGYITGIHRSPFHGFSVEFSEYRPYNPGESTRFIDWKLYARTDKLFVKQFEDETNLRARIIIDASNSMLYPMLDNVDEELRSKYNMSMYMTAVFLLLFYQQRDAAGLSLVSNEILEHTHARSSYTYHRYLLSLLDKYLLEIQKLPKTETLLSQNIHEIADRIHKRSLVIIISDLFEANLEPQRVINALQHLKYNNNEVIVFHLLDKQSEWNFDFKNRPYLFTDMENGEKIKLHPRNYKDLYLNKISDYHNQLKINLLQLGIDYNLVYLQDGLEGILLPFFIKRM
ncbi:MAG TPA: DUF58 domain-containing protein [Bacteroidales bacterium]|nr:DUF58 domain-containing protein [Bacteroidales bacterium]HOV54740.1 DUF58 domain-containing protein [Bacteroidales bacterium]HQH59638.1 DUF58 domain-containing protein [Bacteroidales bacterium]HRC78816.1 DUF58 domain-containing protein [Bacteroidales bacterium]HRR52990.1 DUF58 domain-containing protein [Bacteroidales bacterium]